MINRKCTAGAIAAVAALLLSGCEQATGTQTLARPHPRLAEAQAFMDMPADELILLLETADRVQQQYLSGELRLPRTGHPLDGLSPVQIQELFAAAGIPAEPYLPKTPACRTRCPGAGDSR